MLEHPNRKYDSRRLITRNQAMLEGLTRYFTGNPCPHGHVAERNLSSGGCVECLRLYTKKYRARVGYSDADRERSRIRHKRICAQAAAYRELKRRHLAGLPLRFLV